MPEGATELPQSMNLTDAIFWDEYWKGVKLPAVVDTGFSFDRCLALKLCEMLKDSHGEVLEIGCAPGKWLAFMARERGLLPSGIDNCAAGAEITRQNLQLQGIRYGQIWQADFLELAPVCRFDIVVSLGFIEHFRNVREVVARHREWLKPGGMLVIGIPNFRGVHGWFQSVLDRGILARHNREIMHPGYFREMARWLHLEVITIDYLGSFEPSLPIGRPGVENLRQFLAKALLGVLKPIRRVRSLDRLNASWLSSYLLAVYRSGRSS